MTPVALLVLSACIIGAVNARPQSAEASASGRAIPGLPREFQNVNIENYLRVNYIL